MKMLMKNARSLAAAGILCLFAGIATARPPSADVTKAQAIARVRAILARNTRRCSINRVNSVTAARVAAGWRVTAMVLMSASGRRLTERTVWLVDRRNRVTPQNQLTAEVNAGCFN